jgi:hypothetical protein
MQIRKPKISANTMQKYRDLIGREIHVTAVQPPLNYLVGIVNLSMHMHQTFLFYLSFDLYHF